MRDESSRWDALVGVDGCPDGWVCVRSRGDAIAAETHATFVDLVAASGERALIAIDIPIGLPTPKMQGCTARRAADLKARERLGRRGSSVFPAPVRDVLTPEALHDYRRACDIHSKADGRRMSKQAHAILPKINEVDVLLRADPAVRERVREVHPEVSFTVWAGRPMAHRKARTAGREERRHLIEQTFPGAHARATALLNRTGRRWHHDDLNDAFAALWTARRIAEGTACAVPAEPEFDAAGLPMQIWA